MFFWLGILFLCTVDASKLVYVMQSPDGSVPGKAFEDWLRKLFSEIPEAGLVRIFGAYKEFLASHSIRKVGFISIKVYLLNNIIV